MNWLRRVVAIPIAAFFKFSQVSDAFEAESPVEYEDPIEGVSGCGVVSRLV
jgi:hypothetical protein